MNLSEAIRRLPKTDLHCHLDGSLRIGTILEIAKAENIDLGTTDARELQKILLVGEKVSSLPVFLRAFDITCAVMQSSEAIERIAFELAEDVARENVRYLEARFAPIFCTKNGLSNEEVVLAARKGFAKAEKQFLVQVGITICSIRTLPAKHSIELAELAVSLKNKGVVGFDLAHAEKGHSAHVHTEAFRIAKKAGLGLTVHAGEDAGPESIRDAIDSCGAQRIGHGRTLCEDLELEAEVGRRGICIEACPSSNVQISLTPSFSEHPLKRYLENGVNVTLATDNRLLTGITVTDEYLRAAEHLNLSWDQLKQIAINGFRSVFLPEENKKELLRSVEQEIKSLGDVR